MNRQQAVLRGVGAKDDGAGPVSEENAGGAVRPVDDPGEQFGADEQDGAGGARLDVLVRDGETVDESGAGGRDVESGSGTRAEAVLNEAGRRGEEHIGRRRRDEDEVDVAGLDVSGAESKPGRAQGELRTWSRPVPRCASL